MVFRIETGGIAQALKFRRESNQGGYPNHGCGQKLSKTDRWVF
jgi:hypothetical protein